MSYNLVDPTTGDLTRVAGSGTSPSVGTLLIQYKKRPISGYLYCDGSTFDENAYPALYMYLGTNVLPDYRECVMVGAEQNTTDTIATHDVYTEGEFKDDQLQDHKHEVTGVGYGASSGTNWQYSARPPKGDEYAGDVIKTNSNNGRKGDTTHGKQKAVYVYIKATSGLAENQQDNVLNDVKDYVDSKGVFKGYIEPNKKLTINMDLYSEVYGYVQVKGNASIPFRLHNAAQNATPSVFLKQRVTLNEETVYVEKSFGATTAIGSVTITWTNDGVWTITNASTETESYWVGGGVNSVSLSDA